MCGRHPRVSTLHDSSLMPSSQTAAEGEGRPMLPIILNIDFIYRSNQYFITRKLKLLT